MAKIFSDSQLQGMGYFGLLDNGLSVSDDILNLILRARAASQSLSPDQTNGDVIVLDWCFRLWQRIVSETAEADQNKIPLDEGLLERIAISTKVGAVAVDAALNIMGVTIDDEEEPMT